MAKLTNIRERVHQPFRDALMRASGMEAGTVQDRTELFRGQNTNEGSTNLPFGGTLPSDQSMVVLALRVFMHFRNPIQRGATVVVAGGTNYPQFNGDFAFAGAAATYSAAQSAVANGQAPGQIQDVHRLYFQGMDQLLWTFGTGEKPSIKLMPSAYFPYGGGLHGQLGGATDLIYWCNGTPDHAGILRLARAVLIPPRQNVNVTATIVALTSANSGLFNNAQGTRSMLSFRDNLNAPDLITKCVTFTFDGLQSRDVQ